MLRQSFTDARYDCIADFLSAVDLPCVKSVNEKMQHRFLDEYRCSDWFGAGCHTGRKVIKTMQEGWREGRERLASLRDNIATVELTPLDMRRRPLRAASGDHLDMTAVWAGRLDTCWRTARRQSTQGPQKVELVANMLCSGDAHSDTLFWRGAAAVVLADLLEQAGYMVRLAVVFGGMADWKLDCSCRITVKEFGTPLDISSTSAVILPGFFRALGHAWIANHCPHKRDMGGITIGQGKVDESEVLLSHAVNDHGTAVAFVNGTIEKINSGLVAKAA